MPGRTELPGPFEPVVIPRGATLAALRKASAGCRGCDLYQRATQTVFGEGRAPAALMLVGEEPSDKEDLAGRPFVGPAGKLLDKALVGAGIDRGAVYVTNVVKHFKWRAQGKRRIHEKPNAAEIAACRPWLEAEIARVKPRVLLCLGATAAQALIGRQFRVTRQRGEVLESPLAPRVLATVHPSSILRSPDSEIRRRETERFFSEMRQVAALLR